MRLMIFPMPRVLAVWWNDHAYMVLWGRWWIVFSGWTKKDVLVGWWKPVAQLPKGRD